MGKRNTCGRVLCGSNPLGKPDMDAPSKTPPPMDGSARLPRSVKAGYALGSLCQNLNANGISNLANYVLNIGLGMNPALVGLLQALPRLFDALLDPLIGNLSDEYRSKYGRRRPFMIGGALAAGLLFAALWFLPADWPSWAQFAYFLVFSILFYVGAAFFGVSWMALGYSMTSDYNERTRLMAWNTFGGAIAGIGLAWLFALTKLPVFSNELNGSRAVGVVVGIVIIVSGLASVFLCRESKAASERQSESGHGFARNVAQVLSNRPFLLLSGTITAMCLGIFSILSITPYATIYYVCGGDLVRGATYVGLAGTVWQVTSLVMAPVVGWLGVRLGKLRALQLFLGLALIGNFAKWICYQPNMPWLSVIPAAFNALGFCALWTLTYSMTADTCDLQEYNTHSRADGLIGSLQWWMMKLGTSAAFLISGILLNWSGYSATKGAAQTSSTLLEIRLIDIGVPAVFISLAIVLMRYYPLSEARVREIQLALQKRKALAMEGTASS